MDKKRRREEEEEEVQEVQEEEEEVQEVQEDPADEVICFIRSSFQSLTLQLSGLMMRQMKK